MSQNFQAGSIVTARGREWIVLPDSRGETLHLRPVGGSEMEATWIDTVLEPVPPAQASFPLPGEHDLGPSYSAFLFKDAMLLKTRAGAGPFRSFGNIAIEPRAYQLVPLMMAMRQSTVRLLVADDVGIGKTIESGLIVRELLDRGEIERFSVLVPPHLCEQWQEELSEHFQLDATVVRSSTIKRLERALPPGTSIFEAHPFTVVSLDYIKSDRHRDEFLRSCPECVIVDEAHTCTLGSNATRQKRYELLKDLSRNPERHMLLLTATPHSGDDIAFYNMLALLDMEFLNLADTTGEAKKSLREKLAMHFVQRRRPDIDEWHDQSLFPEKREAEVTYRLTGEWGGLFDEVIGYARELVVSSEGESQYRRRLTWWAALALLRCLSSSPMAAVSALRNRLRPVTEEQELEEELARRIFDGTEDDLESEDIEPSADTGHDDARLNALIAQAQSLATPSKDPKLKTLLKALEELLNEGFRPVIFCRYIATAHYLTEYLGKKFKKASVSAVTGELTPSERQEKVESLGLEDTPILVATDCLSEGINLQEHFTAVLHYDLSWNPTRHEQREGRVDRFGQRAKEVRAVMLYGEDNPIDGAVLDVILRKAKRIRQELGVMVPMPDDEERITQALMRTLLLKKGSLRQKSLFDFLDETPEVHEFTLRWESAWEKAKSNRTIFAQRGLKPSEVLPEWEKSRQVLGTPEDVYRFVSRIAKALDAPLESRRDGTYLFYLHRLPEALRELLSVRGYEGTLKVDFRYPAAPDALHLHRSSPLVSTLADYASETALDEEQSPWIARAGVFFTDTVSERTVVALARLRLGLVARLSSREHTILCEESLMLDLGDGLRILDGEERARLDAAQAIKNMPRPIQARHLSGALQKLEAQSEALESLARERAQILLEDHRRIRDASKARGSYTVKPILPMDILGIAVLVPAIVDGGER
jgi:superfamily II DNA or RNA helicase